MSVSDFYNLSPGDRVLIPKSPFQLVQHHGICAGNSFFYENVIGKGVVRTHENVFFAGVQKITAIHRFAGSPQQLYLAMQRAKSLLGQPYQLLTFNCEHYANYVLSGESRSQQVENAKEGGGLFLTLALVAVVASRQ